VVVFFDTKYSPRRPCAPRSLLVAFFHSRKAGIALDALQLTGWNSTGLGKNENTNTMAPMNRMKKLHGILAMALKSKLQAALCDGFAGEIALHCD